MLVYFEETTMKKNSLLPGILSIIAILAIGAALLLPLGTGLIANIGTKAEPAAGYDFVLGNDALLLNDPHGGMIAWFVLLLIAAFFGLVGTITGFFGGKVGAFFNFLAGVLALISALLFFLSPVMVGDWWVGSIPEATVSLGWGYLSAGIAAAVAGVIDLFLGVKGLFAKKA